ncbi:hypothetical protein [Gordonia oryzae]|uniref:hypothetical protein n=1 Tax=Gordonia oryzae TaxID=2487349 RepID=UPI003F83DC01
MDSVERILKNAGVELGSLIVNSKDDLNDGPWDTYVEVVHFGRGSSTGTDVVILDGEPVVDRSTDISMMDYKKLKRYIRGIRKDFPVPFWLFDALVLVVDRESGRGVVHVVCGDVAADFEASMGTADVVQDRAIDMFGDLVEPSVVCGRPIVVPDGGSAVDRVEAFVAVSPVSGFVVEDAVVSRVDGGWRVFVRDRPGQIRVDRTYFLVGDDGGVFPVSSGEPPAQAVARLLGRR